MNTTKRLILNTFWLLLGGILLVLSLRGVIDEIYIGFGTGLIACGAVMLLRHARYQADAGYQEKIDTAINDERNHYLRMKAWSWAGYLFVIMAGLATIICMILKQSLLMQFCSGALCLIVCLYWISFLVLRRKY